MYFEYSDKVKKLQKRVAEIVNEVVIPNEETYIQQLAEIGGNDIPPIAEEWKALGKKEGLWNLFLQDEEYGAGLTNLEYAPLKEIMGRSMFGTIPFNSSAPDTGNMELLAQYGNEEQKQRWLVPLLNGEIRSAFVMTEPGRSCSDATNVSMQIVRDGDEYVLNGTKWFSSGVMSKQCKFMIVMGKTDPNAPRYKQQSMIIVPMDTEGVEVKRNLPVFGYDDGPGGHAVVEFNNVRVPAENLILGEGRGFEIAQGRLGPGRIHHAMRTIGAAERALELMVHRVNSRETFGVPIIERGVIRQWIADSRMEIEQARLLTLKAAYMMDTVGNKVARKEIAMIKVVCPNMALKVIDRAIQAFGAEGVTNTTPLANLYASTRTLRLADGPDEVHRETITKLEIKEILGE